MMRLGNPEVVKSHRMDEKVIVHMRMEDESDICGSEM